MGVLLAAAREQGLVSRTNKNQLKLEQLQEESNQLNEIASEFERMNSNNDIMGQIAEGQQNQSSLDALGSSLNCLG